MEGHLTACRELTFGTYPTARPGSTLYLMNNHSIAPTSVPQSFFLDGRAECGECGAHVRPSTATRALVRISNPPRGTAWCSVCCTTTDYELESRPVVQLFG